MGKNYINRKVSILVIISAFLLTACQSLPFHSTKQALRHRVNDMMAARVAQNWGAVYEFLDSDYKDKVTEEDFKNMKREILFSDFSVESIEISRSGQEAVVTVKYNMTVMAFDVADHRETQNWVRDGGTWYYKMDTGSIMDKE